MRENTGNSSITPHTEYARTHIQCLRCGNTVPRAGGDDTDHLCVRCEDAVTP